MPTAEAKSQANPEKPKEIEEVSQPPLKNKIWVLKVRIHCEGCIKEVEKILKKIDGVFRTDSDGKIGKESKVTVTGNVEPEILIKALAKGGKHAEMCFGGDYDEDGSDCEVEKSRGGGGGRGGASSSGTKKNKKWQKGNANAGDSDEDAQCGDAAPPRTGSPPYHGNVPRLDFAPAPAPAYHMAPHLQMYEYYQYPRQNYDRLPIQAMNFNTAYPASSYGVSQYAAPLPHAHSYTYASHHSDSYPQYYTSPPPYNSPQQSDSFGLFSDENPNGCSIM
ncbi:hypothetical protein PS2_010348 [Malus domestica]